MSRNTIFLYLGLGLLFILYVVLEVNRPKPLDWQATFLTFDKNPYGAFILNEQLEDLFHQGARSSFTTLYESRDSTENILILASNFSPSDIDLEILLQQLNQGKDVLIAAESFSPTLCDTLGFEFNYDLELPHVFEADTVNLRIFGESIAYNRALMRSHFQEADSTWESHARDWENRPILIQKSYQETKLTLCSVPLLFTNYALLEDHRFAELALNELRNEPVHYTQFYHSGKIGSNSPFRYVLSEEALTWGLYLGLFTLAALLLVNSQRRQRKIPIHARPENTTISFIKTLGALFYHQKDYTKAGQNLANHYTSKLKRSFIRKPEFTENYYEFISLKTGVEKAVVVRTFDQIHRLQHGGKIDEAQLKAFYKDLKSLQ